MSLIVRPPHDSGGDRTWTHRLLLACFFLSGAGGLIYEVVWTRKLALILGSTTLSVSITLAAYLGGMAVGAYLFGRLADRLKRPAFAYGAMEVGIGLYGALSLWVLDAVGPSYVSIQSALNLSGLPGSLFQLALVSLGLLVPTILMGGTLPVLIRTDPTGRFRLGAQVGRLYAGNTAGAVVGAAITGFVLLPQIGMQRSLLIAAAMNVTLGAIVLLVFRHRVQAPASRILSIPSETGSSAPPSKKALRPALIWTLVFVSGFCALFYEVVWTRALDLILGSSTRAFSLMLTTFLLGLSGGIGVGGWMVRRGRHSPFALALLQIGVSLSIFSTGALLQHLPVWFLEFYTRFVDQPGLFTLSQAGLCGIIILIPATLIGTAFPLAIELAGRREGREGEQVGSLYALNTVGCILGAALAGLVLIPTIGMHRSLLLGVWLNLGLAALLGAHISGMGLIARLAGISVPVALAVILTVAAPGWNHLLMTSGVHTYAPIMVAAGIEKALAEEAAAKLLFYREGPTGTVTVKARSPRRWLAVDGRGEGNDRATAQYLLGHLPFATGRPIEDVFIIGMGTGSTAGMVTLYPVRTIDVVEIEPAVIEGAKQFADTNHRPWADPRVRIRVGDARNILSVSPPDSSDVIISQPSTPWVAGASKLFTVEFYRLAHAHLRPKGLMVQWVQLYNLDYGGVMALMKSFTEVFPQTLALQAGVTPGEILLIGAKDPISLSWEAVTRLFADPRLSKDLLPIDVSNPGTFLAQILLGPDEIRRLAAEFPINTDDNGLLEFTALGSLYRKTNETNAERLRRAAGAPLAYVANAPEGRARGALLLEMATAARLGRDFRRGLAFAEEAARLDSTADSLLILGDLQYELKVADEGVEAWRQAIALDPSNPQLLARLVRHYREVAPAARPADYRRWCARLGQEPDLCD